MSKLDLDLYGLEAIANHIRQPPLADMRHGQGQLDSPASAHRLQRWYTA